MSFSRLFGGGAPRRSAGNPAPDSAPSDRQSKQSAEPPHQERISARLNRFTARASEGLPSEFVPEELGTMYVASRAESLEQAERDTRPL